MSLTATVSVVAPGSGVPNGTVAFYDGATLLATVDLGTGRVGRAAVVLPAGVHSLTAVYSGAANYNASTSPIRVQTVT